MNLLPLLARFRTMPLLLLTVWVSMQLVRSGNRAGCQSRTYPAQPSARLRTADLFVKSGAGVSFGGAQVVTLEGNGTSLFVQLQRPTPFWPSQRTTGPLVVQRLWEHPLVTQSSPRSVQRTGETPIRTYMDLLNYVQNLLVIMCFA